MITSEMRNMMVRDQLLSDITKIKEELESLKMELAQVKEVLRERNRL